MLQAAADATSLAVALATKNPALLLDLVKVALSGFGDIPSPFPPPLLLLLTAHIKRRAAHIFRNTLQDQLHLVVSFASFVTP